jgi:hypothetical protein
MLQKSPGSRKFALYPRMGGMNDTQDLLDSDHPSFGTRNATFQFALENPRTGALVRFILVEANNPYAVAAIERVLIQNEQRVSENCRALCIFRDTTTNGIRDGLVEEIPYIDFMTDIVEPGWLLADPVNVSCFNRSISAEEKEYALAKTRMLGQAPEVEATPMVEASEPGQRVRLLAALTGMGFKKTAVSKFVDSLGARVDHAPLPDLLREGLRSLAS